MPALAERIAAAFRWMPEGGLTALVQKAEDAADKLLQVYADEKGCLDVQDALALYDENFLSWFAYDSSAIEGSKLTPMEAGLVLEGEFLPHDLKEVSDLLMVRGSAEGYGYMLDALDEGRVLDAALIKDIHERCALDCSFRIRGTFRRVRVYIRGSETVLAEPDEIEDLIEVLLRCRTSSAQPRLVRAAAFHAMFENIHPFQDGNGRCGRILLCRDLLLSGLPPVSVEPEDRSRYLKGLEMWQTAGDGSCLTELLAEAVLKEAEKRLSSIEITLDAVEAARKRLEADGSAKR